MPIPDPAYTPIDALPPAPLRGTQPEVFIPTAEAFLSAIIPFGTQANTLASQMVVLAQVAEQGATDALGYLGDTQAAVLDAQAAVTAAQSWADAAAISAGNAASAAEAVTATSSTSMTFATGTKTLVLNEMNKPYIAGQWVYFTDPASPSTRWLHGTITSFTSSTGNMTIDVVSARGTGSHDNWIAVNAVPLYGVPTFDASGNAMFTGNVYLQTNTLGLFRARGGSGTGNGSGFLGTNPNADTTMFALADRATLFGGTAGATTSLYSNQNLTFDVGGSTRMQITTGGTVSIGGNTVWHAGNFNPATKLDTTANAASATKLQTARLINGVAFDGTADITITAGAGTYLPLSGGTLTGGLTGTTANFTSGLSMNGNAVWHAGNFTPSSYALLASPNFTGTPTISGNAVWHAGTFNPANYATIAGGPVFTAGLGSRMGDSGSPFTTQNSAAANATQFFVTHNLSETQVGNARGALNLYASGLSRLLLNTTGVYTTVTMQSTGLLYGNTNSSEGNGLGRVYVSTAAPSGGAQGDIWCRY